MHQATKGTSSTLLLKIDSQKSISQNDVCYLLTFSEIIPQGELDLMSYLLTGASYQKFCNVPGLVQSWWKSITAKR